MFDLFRWFHRPTAARKPSRRPSLEGLEAREVPATLTWTGAGTTTNFSDAANWSANAAPRNGDALVFAAGPTQQAANNDLVNRTFKSLSFQAPGYSLTGNGVRLTGGVQASASADVDLDSVYLTRTSVFNVAAGAELRLSGDLNGTATSPISGASLVKAGGGTLVITGGGSSNYFGGTYVTAGELHVSRKGGPATGAMLTDLAAGTSLVGLGPVRNVIARAGSTLDPDGQLDARSVLLASGSSFAVNVGQDKLTVNGRLTIQGGTLDLTAVSGDAMRYTVIDNDGTDAVAGRFAGLPEGATVTFAAQGSSTREFTISYKGGTGNDVVLTELPAKVNLAPVVAFGGTPLNFIYTADPAKALDAGLLVSDADSANLAGATVALTGGLDANDVLSWGTLPSGVTTLGYGSGAVTFTGAATVADYQALLRTVKFYSLAKNSGPRQVTFTVSDGLTSGSAQRTFQVSYD